MREPGLYVSHVQELPRGDVFDVEVLHLPVAGQPEKEVRLVLRTEDGKEVFRSDAWKVRGEDSKAITYSIPTAGLEGRVLMPSLEYDGQSHGTATFAIVRDGRVERPNTIHSSLANVLKLKTAQFALEEPADGQPTARIDVAGDAKLQRVEVVRNDVPVYSAAYERNLRQMAPEGGAKQIGFYWDAPGPVPGIDRNFSGSVSLSGGHILQAFHPSKGLPIKQDGTTATWKLTSYTPREAAQVVFTGDEATEFTFRMPTQKLDAKVRWSDVAEGKEKIIQINPYTQLTIKRVDGPIGYPLAWGERTFQKSVTLPAGGERHPDVYHLRVIGEDGSIFRSPPVFAAAGEHDTGARDILLWDRANNQRFTQPVTWEDFRPVRWSFDNPSPGARLPDDLGVGFEALPGGSFDRDGRFRPNQVPQAGAGRQGGGLHFDGDDILLVRPNLLPPGAWFVEMWIQPESVLEPSPQCLFQCAEVANLQIDDGRLNLRFGDKTAHVDLKGATALQNGQWYRVRVVYDLEHVRLYLDGKLEAEAAVGGYRSNISGRTTFGAALLSKNMSGAVQGFRGTIDEVVVGIDVSGLESGGRDEG